MPIHYYNGQIGMTQNFLAR